MMFWAKVELINLEPTSEAQRIPGYTIDSLYHRILYPSTEEGGFHPFLSCAAPQHGNTSEKKITS